MIEKNADAIQTIQSLVAEGRLDATPGLVPTQPKTDDATGVTTYWNVLVSVTGETYENRETIKAAGLRWNKVHRAWEYSAPASREDAVLMALVPEFTERKVESLEESARRAALTDEEREAEDAERRRAAERSVAGERRGLSRKMRARGLAK